MKHIADVMNGFDRTAWFLKTPSSVVRQQKVEYAKTLEGDERTYAFWWIHNQ